MQCIWDCSLAHLLYLQNSIFADLFYFSHLIFMVTNCKEQSHSVTQYNLNCITCSALHRFPPVIYISSRSSIVLCSPGCAQGWFLHCLLEVIGRSWTAALGSMYWSISSLTARTAWRVIRAQGRRWSRLPLRHGRSRWNPLKDWINDWPLKHSHSCVIGVVTPRERAGHLVLLEVGLSADQCNTSVCRGREVKRKNKC